MNDGFGNDSKIVKLEIKSLPVANIYSLFQNLDEFIALGGFELQLTAPLAEQAKVGTVYEVYSHLPEFFTIDYKVTGFYKDNTTGGILAKVQFMSGFK